MKKVILRKNSMWLSPPNDSGKPALCTDSTCEWLPELDKLALGATFEAAISQKSLRGATKLQLSLLPASLGSLLVVSAGEADKDYILLGEGEKIFRKLGVRKTPKNFWIRIKQITD